MALWSKNVGRHDILPTFLYHLSIPRPICTRSYHEHPGDYLSSGDRHARKRSSASTLPTISRASFSRSNSLTLSVLAQARSSLFGIPEELFNPARRSPALDDLEEFLPALFARLGSSAYRFFPAPPFLSGLPLLALYFCLPFPFLDQPGDDPGRTLEHPDDRFDLAAQIPFLGLLPSSGPSWPSDRGHRPAGRAGRWGNPSSSSRSIHGHTDSAWAARNPPRECTCH